MMVSRSTALTVADIVPHGVPPQDTPEFGDYLVLMRAVMREENDCRWLERCVELCGGEGLGR